MRGGYVDQFDKEDAVNLVIEFGSKLKQVTLLAPEDIVRQEIQENWKEYVSQPLLEKWLDDPSIAPGRLTSSPWPERIDVLTVEESEKEYHVTGEIIEITSVEQEQGGSFLKRPVTLVIIKTDLGWRIDEVNVGPYQEVHTIEYSNNEYGFVFTLPNNWLRYTVITDKWEGIEPEKGLVVETGPMIYIRHPEWTQENPRQDIPIMVFTKKQWESLEQRQFSVGAAPVGPGRLGGNDEYVFALPARYNYAFLTGYEEVETILQSNPLRAN